MSAREVKCPRKHKVKVGTRQLVATCWTCCNEGFVVSCLFEIPAPKKPAKKGKR